MARTVPGSGAVIKPIFNEVFGVRAVEVLDGGSGYDSSDPPQLTVTGCGTPVQEALLYPIIDDDSGRIIHVRVLASGSGYDPLRLSILPVQDTPNVVSSFDIKRIWQSNNNSITSAAFQTQGTRTTDRLVLVSDNHPKPADYPGGIERQPGGSSTQAAVYTPTDADYNPTTGDLVLTIGTHTITTDNFVRIANNSITFTCALDNHQTNHPYPRPTDPIANQDIPVLAVTATTITVNVLAVAPSTYTGEHRFVSAVANAVSLRAYTVQDRTFNQTFIYRGGKDVPYVGTRPDQLNKAIGIMANGGLLHTPEWGTTGGAPAGFGLDVVKYPYLKSLDAYDGALDNGTYYYHSSKVSDHFALKNGIYENGLLQTFVWRIKVEFDNVLLPISDLDESLGQIELGRIVEKIGGGAAGTIAKIVRDGNNTVTRVYVRLVSGTFADGDKLLGTNGFVLTVGDDPITFPSGIFYIDFGPDAEEFGDFTPGVFYFAPENIRVQRNYQIIWDSSDPSNRATALHQFGHPMQFSKTADGLLNGGTLYTDTDSGNYAVDYENEFAPLFIMNADEDDRIYYYCKYHRYMSGYTGDEGYMVLDPTVESHQSPNNYYISDFYSSGGVDYSRHANGHSKILGMTFDGYPIYGPWGYTSGTTVGRMTSSFRLKTGVEIDGNRPPVVTPSTVTYTVTVASGKFAFDGTSPDFITLERGKTYVFNQDDVSNEDNFILFSTTSDGWHTDPAGSLAIGTTSYLYQDAVTYYIDGAAVDYSTYIGQFNAAATREVRIAPRVDAPGLLYIFAYINSGLGLRTVQTGYQIGDLVNDYIYDPAVGLLDAFNGKFAVTPEYPNGTYCYFLTEDSNGDPQFPYCIGPQFYGAPVFEGDVLPPPPGEFPSGAAGDVVLNDSGQVAYVKMTKNGDGYFGPAQAKILGGEGSGATGTPTVQSVTGLTLLNPGRSFATPPTLIFEGGGGQDATGSASIDTTGKVTSINVVNPGEFYNEPPFVFITGGGGLGAKAVARIEQGEVVGIDVTDPGIGYINPPQIIFTKLVNLKRKTANRQSYNSSQLLMTGLLKNATASEDTIYVSSTDSFPGSGRLILGNETISYASKSRERFTGLTRGINFNYDQRIVLDTTQNDSQGNSTYQYSVGDRIVRRIENQNNKVAKVYDWNPANRELLVTFEVDELAFIDAGVPSTEDAIVQFDAGVYDSAQQGFDPHVIVTEVGSNITTLTVPIGVLNDRAFEDDDEQDGAGDGIPDLVNTGTAYENQISLDGGIHNSLYGIEETQGGQNTTLFQAGDQIKDASLPFKYATIIEAGQLSEGRPITSEIEITVDANFGSGSFSVNEVITGAISGVRATVTQWTPSTGKLRVKDVIPYDTGNINIGIAGLLYSFSHDSTIVDFIIQNPGADYSAVPTLTIESASDLAATTTVVMTPAGDQIASVNITNGGYGYEKYVDNTFAIRPTVDVTNAVGDTTGTGGVVEAIMGGENISGNSATYRIKSIEYLTVVRSE